MTGLCVMTNLLDVVQEHLRLAVQAEMRMTGIASTTVVHAGLRMIVRPETDRTLTGIMAVHHEIVGDMTRVMMARLSGTDEISMAVTMVHLGITVVSREIMTVEIVDPESGRLVRLGIWAMGDGTEIEQNQWDGAEDEGEMIEVDEVVEDGVEDEEVDLLKIGDMAIGDIVVHRWMSREPHFRFHLRRCLLVEHRRLSNRVRTSLGAIFRRDGNRVERNQKRRRGVARRTWL